MATIGEEIETIFISSDVTDPNPVFSNTTNAFLSGQTVQHDKYLYLNNNNSSIVIATFDPEKQYTLEETSFKDGKIQIYTNGDGGVAPKMPSEYAAHDTSFDSSVWANRYIYLGENTGTYPYISLEATQDNGNNDGVNMVISTTLNNGVYTYNYEAISVEGGDLVDTSTILTNPASATTINTGGLSWSSTSYVLNLDGNRAASAGPGTTNILLTSNYDFSYIPDNATITGIEIQMRRKKSADFSVYDVQIQLYQGTTAKGTNASTGTIWSNNLSTKSFGGDGSYIGWDDITIADLKNSNFGVGVRANVGTATTAYIDSVQIKVYYTYQTEKAWTYTSTPTVTNKVTSVNVLAETKPIMHIEDSNYAYEIKTIIIDGTSVYARTNIDYAYENKTITTVWEDVTNPTQVGMLLVGNSNTYKPLDATNISVATKNNSMTYKVKAGENFNAFTLANVLATSLTYTFRNSTNQTIKTETVAINCKRDPVGILSLYPTTVVFYAGQQIEKNGTVEIILSYNGTIQLGTFLLNNAVENGFTKFSFSNSFIDYNDNQPDEFGFIEEGNKPVVDMLNIQTAIFVEKYTDHKQFFKSIAKKFVTVDGNDGMGTIGALVSRAKISNFTLTSEVLDGELGKMASISFTATEVI